LNDARSQRGKYQRDHQEEQHAQKDLAERIEHGDRDAGDDIQHRRKDFIDTQGDDSGDHADGETPENACCQRRGLLHPSNVRGVSPFVIRHLHVAQCFDGEMASTRSALKCRF
jgi:hypothetical protein